MTRTSPKQFSQHLLWLATASLALALGLPEPPPVRAFGVAFGVVCGTALFAVLARSLPRLPRNRTAAAASATIGLRAAHEEAVWRGGLLLLLATALGPGLGAATGTAAFALAHTTSQGRRAGVHLVTGGAFSALALGLGLAAAMAAHATYNVLIGTGIAQRRHRPFRPVSGSSTHSYARPTSEMRTQPRPEVGQSLLRLDGVVRHFGSVAAVDGLDLDVRAGEIVALLGANGAGKSTAIGLAVGLRSPDAGRVTLFGGDPRRPASRTALGVAAQEASFPPTARVAELVDLVRSHFRAPAPLDGLLAEFGLSHLRTRLAGGLSGGERRRLALALAFAGRPRLLVLDEPSAGLDVGTRRGVWDSIQAFRSGGGAVLLTTHYLEEAEAMADSIVVIDGGRVRARGTALELRAASGTTRISLRADRLPELPSSTRVERTADGYVLSTREPDRVVGLIAGSGIPFHGLEVTRPSLEEAFLDLTREDR